jgi:hypothetical protein
MGSKEKEVINSRLLSLDEHTRLFRANCGMAWTGEITRKGDFLIIHHPRPFHGLPEGFPDLFGLTSVEITPEMVGQKVAIFLAEECKTGKLQLSEKQRLFKKMVIELGGIFRVIRD